jgi:flagellar assembly protein FliH
MILLSSIIKAEYVVINDRGTKVNKVAEMPEVTTISTPREDLYDIYNQREIILKEANAEALKIINTAKRNAQTDIAECKKRGYEEGYNAGMEVGKNKGFSEGYEVGKVSALEELQKQFDSRLDELVEMLTSVENEKDEIILKYEDKLTKLALDISEKIIKQKINSEDNLVSGIIKNAIKDYRNVEWIKIYISAKDDAIAIQADKNLINELNRISSDVKIEVTEELDRGSAIVETSDGIIDASTSTQLKNLKEMVLNKNAI